MRSRRCLASLTSQHSRPSELGTSGKKGALTAASAGMRDVPKEEKPAIGQKLNEVRGAITAALDEKSAILTAAADAEAAGDVDVTLPGRRLAKGALHPLTQIQRRATQILRRMGFALAEGPEIETEWHCFDALNTPAGSPGAQREGHLLFRQRQTPAHPHLQRADPHHGSATRSAGPDHRPRQRLPPRRDRRDPPQQFQSARRPLRRREGDARRSQGHAGVFLPSDVRRRRPRCASARISSRSPSPASRST